MYTGGRRSLVISYSFEVQEELIPSLVVQLNESRGVIESAQLPELELGTEKRSNITMLAGRIGVALCERPASHHFRLDRPLDVYSSDFRRASLDALSYGFYIPRSDPRYKDAKNLRVAILGDLPLSIHLQGVRRPDMGVTLGKGEYPKIVPYPGPLAARAIAQTLDARAEAIDREESREAAYRAGGHILERKLVGLRELDQRFIGEYALLLSLHRDARVIWRTTYLTKNLDRKRQAADELIHDIVEVAANSLGYSTPDTNATHRAFTSKMYRRGSARQLAESWREITRWSAMYINAKRGKVNQSINGCEQVLRIYQPYLDRKASAAA